MATADGHEKATMADGESEIEPGSALPTAAGRAPIISAEGGQGNGKEHLWNFRGRGGLCAAQGLRNSSQPFDCGDSGRPCLSSNGHDRSTCFPSMYIVLSFPSGLYPYAIHLYRFTALFMCARQSLFRRDFFLFRKPRGRHTVGLSRKPGGSRPYIHAAEGLLHTNKSKLRRKNGNPLN